MPEYRKPGPLVRVMNSGLGLAIKLGLSPQGGQLLTVRGRKSGKPMTTLAFEKRWNPMLGLGREAFVSQISEGIPPKPADIETILLFNRGRAS